MTEEIIIDVSNCPHKSDDDCMEVPICNEYGDLMGYQSCEAQTLCPYRSQKKILRLEQENKVLRKTKSKLLADLHEANDICNAWEKEVNKLRSALEEIKNIITQAVVTNNKKLRAILDKINEVLGC